MKDVGDISHMGARRFAHEVESIFWQIELDLRDVCTGSKVLASF